MTAMNNDELRCTPFVIVDVETTGLCPGRHRIIELGAVRLQKDEQTACFQRLLPSVEKVPPFITRFTGITTDMLTNQPSTQQTYESLLAFLGDDDVIVAHNLPFDRKFIHAELARHRLNNRVDPPRFSDERQRVVCTLRLARRLLPWLPSKKLCHVVEAFKIPIKNSHRALGDAQMTTEVLRRFIDMLHEQYDIHTLDGLLEFQYLSGKQVQSLALRCGTSSTMLDHAKMRSLNNLKRLPTIKHREKAI
ncbi:hypothetical protein CYMTET_42670 [Cymbomonas tetramitiformis]|uniref:Exonuclease domain-containing protein n=1 Tax=Cymbomonas tetramitiformis TaxID=36881 RepID=A0AAE0C4S4_9CHLO|nr:hypothetical protein CYMTET_42670 [Cymbomonas tetramitiformis]